VVAISGLGSVQFKDRGIRYVVHMVFCGRCIGRFADESIAQR